MARKKKTATERVATELLDSLMEGRSPEDLMRNVGLMDALTERVLEGEFTRPPRLREARGQRRNGGNSRNRHTRKRVKTDTSDFAIEEPLGRDSTFDPQFVRKGQRRLGGRR